MSQANKQTPQLLKGVGGFVGSVRDDAEQGGPGDIPPAVAQWQFIRPVALG
jgi:hypothetical protein